MENQNNNKQKYTNSLSEMMLRVENEPARKFIYSGISEKSLGVIYGSPKSGKTSYAECLGMSIASGEKEFIGVPIDLDNRKVLMISLEEHYTSRTMRNGRQCRRLIIKHGREWLNNFIVVNDDMPTFIEDEAGWKTIEETIKEAAPGFVIIDSLTRLCSGAIEESKSARQLMKKLKGMVEACQTTICLIHHSHKLYDKPLLRDTMAGSRVVGQEFEFIIGVNKTNEGVRYLKEVDFRYFRNIADTVKTFELDDDSWINITGEAYEYKLLSANDGRQDDTNKIAVLECVREKSGDESKIVSSAELHTACVDSGIMSKQTLFTNLQKLTKEGLIIKVSKGAYQIAA